MASRSRVLYTGVTNDLGRRVHQHKRSLTPGFTSRYHITRLVYFEEFGDVRDAIAREKQLKGWVRSRKVKQILRACGAQDDRPVRSAKGKGRNGTTLPPLLSFSLFYKHIAAAGRCHPERARGTRATRRICCIVRRHSLYVCFARS